MAKALIVYGSTTGNTESTANTIAKVIGGTETSKPRSRISARQAPMISVTPTISTLWAPPPGGMMRSNFRTTLPSSTKTWMSWTSRARRWPCSDAATAPTPTFCGAVDALEEKARELGAELVTTGLKIDGDPYDFEDDILGWADSVAKAV